MYLRPTNGPLLNAPRNSTQFIIADHESQPLGGNEGGGDIGGNGGVGIGGDDDDDVAWAEYEERDFQSVYERARQEKVAEWDRKRLCEEIASLERRQRELVGVLARLDPEVCLRRLQREAAGLREANRALREERAALQPAVSPDSSSSPRRAGGGGGGGGSRGQELTP